MASQTPNLRLRKPDVSDRVDVSNDIAANMDLIDAAVTARAAAVHTHGEADVTNLSSDLAAKASTASVTATMNSHKADSAAHAGTYVPVDGLVYNVKDHGAVGNGTTDDRAAINTTIAAANAAGGGIVFFPAGTYKVASSPGITLLANVHLDFADGASILQGWWPGDTLGAFNGLVSGSGTYTDTDVTGAVLTVNATAGATTLTMTSTANLTVGNFYLLGADKAFANSPDTGSHDNIRYQGEIVRIKSVDSGTQVTVYGWLRDTYATANAASLRAITWLDRVRITNMRIVNPAPGAHISDFIKLSYCRDFSIENVHLEAGDGCGIHLDMCIDGQIAGGRILDLTDDTANFRYGYGINANRATENVTISGLHVRRGRHGFTTNGVDNKRGIPRNITLTGCTSQSSNDSAWDTHVQGANITFSGCSAMGATQTGLNVRSPDTRVLGCSVSHCGQGIALFTQADGSTIKGNSIRHITSGVGHGIQLGGCQNVQILDNLVDETYVFSLYITGGATNCVIERNTFLNPGLQGSQTAGIRVDSASTGTGNQILRNTFGKLPSAGNDPGSGTALLGNPIEILASAATGYRIIGNRAFGALQDAFVSDSGSANAKSDNLHFDRQSNIPQTLPWAIRSGQYCVGPAFGGPGTSNTLGNNTVRVRQLRLLQDTPITAIGVTYTAAGQSGATFRIGIWNDNGTGYPGTLYWDAGSVAVDATPGKASISSSRTIPAGDYWIGGAVQNAGTTQPTMQTENGAVQSMPMTDATSGTFAAGYSQTSVSGAFGTFSASIATVGTLPRVWLLVA